MTTPYAPEPANDQAAASATCPVLHGSPIDSGEARLSLNTAEYAADPMRVYDEMRTEYGSMVPIELAPDVPATLVISYHAAIRILNDPDHFPADPRMWQETIPADSPVRPAMEWRPNARRNTGEAHHRYRQAYTDAVAEIDLHALRSTVEKIATPLINDFCESGSADLIAQYAFPVVFQVLNHLVGCSADIGGRIAAGMAALINTVDATEGVQMISGALMELVQLRRREPAADVTSWMASHPTGLDDTELLFQLLDFYGGGIEPLQNLIANTLLLVIADERFGGSVVGGSLSTRDALDEVLFNDPPLANLCISFPRQPILIDNNWLPAHQPVLISLAACNNDPAIAGGERIGNRSHLAWGGGPHACPAKSVAYLVAQDAADQLLDALPEIRLAVPKSDLVWRPGPFHRSLASLPVVFPETPQLPVL
ncbi:cytochrome P450 [Nocardia sp. NPDC049190]|uniref:cytochrome P450 n=1 Tax=Nocardia sp. NPDC049190 TaxID=3155650 RepID=UPI0033D18313